MFGFKYHQSLFLRALKWQYVSIGFDNGLAPNRRQSNNKWLDMSQITKPTQFLPMPWHFCFDHKPVYRKISLSLGSREICIRIVRSLWNLTGTSAALLSMSRSNFKAIRWCKLPISRLRDFPRSYDKMPYQILKRGPVHQQVRHPICPCRHRGWNFEKCAFSAMMMHRSFCVCAQSMKDDVTL